MKGSNSYLVEGFSFESVNAMIIVRSFIEAQSFSCLSTTSIWFTWTSGRWLMQLLQISSTSCRQPHWTFSNGVKSNQFNHVLAMFCCLSFSAELGLIFDFANARSSAYGDVIMMMSDIMPPWLPLPKRHTRQNSCQIHLLLLTACQDWKFRFNISICNSLPISLRVKCSLLSPCSSVKPIKAWNAVNNVLFANFVFHHLLPNHSMRNVVILCKFYEGNSTFNEDLNKLFNRSSNLRHSSDCLDQDRMDDTLS